MLASEQRHENWFVLTTRPQCELAATSNLNAKGVEAFTPTYRSRRLWSDRTKILMQPLFPGYVFCRISLHGGTRVLGTPGIRAFVTFDHGPEPVPEHEISAILLMVASGLPLEAADFIRVGERVRVTCGPLRGLEGVLSKKERRGRVVVGIQMLQRAVAVEVDPANIEPCGIGSQRARDPRPRFLDAQSVKTSCEPAS